MNWILLIIVIASAAMFLFFVIRLIKGLYRIFLLIVNKILILIADIVLIVSWPIKKIIQLFTR